MTNALLLSMLSAMIRKKEVMSDIDDVHDGRG
jgi:hypothetical protein